MAKPTARWATLHPRFAGSSSKPYKMDKREITPEQSAAVQEVVLAIFADMSNAGCSLVDTLVAIYMTGIEDALSITAENRHDGG